MQHNGVSSLPALVSVMVAFFYLRPPLAAVIGGSVTAGLVAAILLQPGGTVLSAITQLLFVAVLGITAIIMRQAAFNAERAER